VPYVTKLFLQKYQLEAWQTTAGATDGILICLLTLTAKPEFLVGAALIGAGHSLLLKQAKVRFQPIDVED
jgi:hypothetical protein